MLRVISLGAGVQSTTMALMAAHGEIEPMPDCAIFADTQAEPASVYDHLKWLMSPNMLPFPVHIVTRGNLAKDGLELRTSVRSGKVYQKNLIPMFVLNPDGSKGILNRKCTSEYKIRELVKAARSRVGADAIRAWRKNKLAGPLVEQWIGISSDETWRMKGSREEWIVNRWPLIEANISRESCLRWMEAKGYPRPPRSACVFCPYHSDNEWRRLRDDEPEAFAQAVEWERSAQKANESNEAAHGKLFLHKSLKPLDQVDLSTAEDRGQLNLFINECEGMCGV
jgi:hypothetical protein